MAVAMQSADRVSVDGKFFRLGARKFHVKGITYGPFAPNAQGEMFASREQTARDLQQISELGANVLRLYHVPPRWFLDLTAERGLKVLSTFLGLNTSVFSTRLNPSRTLAGPCARRCTRPGPIRLCSPTAS